MSCKFQIRDGNVRDIVEQMFWTFVPNSNLYAGFIVHADKLMLTQTMLRSSVGLKISLVYDMMFLRG